MSVIEAIKEKLNIVDVIGAEIELRRAGKHYKAHCPFREEKTPSFIVFEGTQTYKCFGCGEQGDVIAWVMKRNNWDIHETIRYCAEKAGVPLRPQTAEEKKAVQLQRERDQVLASAMGYFQQRMAKGTPGYTYASGRGWSDETIRAAGLGYFGKDWDGLRKHLQGAGIDLEAPAAVALVGYKGNVTAWAAGHGVKPAQVWVDEGKIPAMIPDVLVYPHIRRGTVSYLQVRSLEGKLHWNLPSELAGGKQPYFNHLWNSKDSGQVVIVEGQADAVTLGEWGIWAAGLAGCEIGDSDSSSANCLLAELKGKVKGGARLCVGLDMDKGGREGAIKVAKWLLENGLQANQFGMVDWPTQSAPTPDGEVHELKDANDWLRYGNGKAEEALGLLARSDTYLDRLIEAAKEDPKTGKRDDDAIRTVFEALTPLDGYEVERVREEISEALGLRRRMFDALLRAARRESGLAEDGQPRYFVEGGRIFARYYDSSGGENVESLCNFDAQIKSDVMRDNGLEPVREFHIGGKLGKRHLKTARVRADQFSEMGWVLRDWGSVAIIEAGGRKKDQLRAAIQYLSREVEHRTIYTHTGWREVEEDGQAKRYYLTAAGAVGKEGIEVELDDDLDLYQVPVHPENPAEAMRASLEFLGIAPERATFPIWSAVWLAPLRELINVAFALWVFGGTGAMKSTLVAAALNHYGGGFDDKHLPCSFVDTANRIEQKAFVVKDALLLIDDFTPQKDRRSASEYTLKAHRIVRDVGNLTGRGRLTSEATARATYAPRGMVAITGEDLPESEALIARLFVVEMFRGDVDIPKLTAFQGQRNLLPNAMGGYVQWLAQNWEGLSQTVPAQWRNYRQRAFGSGIHLRLPEAVAGLALGLEMGLRYAVYLGVVEQEQYAALMEKGWNSMLQGAQGMAQRVHEEKPETLFTRTISEMLTQGRIYLRHRENGKLLGGASDRGEFFGWFDQNYIYMLPEATYNLVAKYFRDQGNVFPVRESTLRKMLEESGILIGREGRRARSEYLEGRTQRVLVLKRAAFSGALETDDPTPQPTEDQPDSSDNAGYEKSEE